MEYFWLTIAIVSLVLVSYDLYTSGSFADNALMLLIPLIAFTYYGFRRAMRKRMEANQSNEGDR